MRRVHQNGSPLPMWSVARNTAGSGAVALQHRERGRQVVVVAIVESDEQRPVRQGSPLEGGRNVGECHRSEMPGDPVDPPVDNFVGRRLTGPEPRQIAVGPDFDDGGGRQGRLVGATHATPPGAATPRFADDLRAALVATPSPAMVSGLPPVFRDCPA